MEKYAKKKNAQIDECSGMKNYWFSLFLPSKTKYMSK